MVAKQRQAAVLLGLVLACASAHVSSAGRTGWAEREKSRPKGRIFPGLTSMWKSKGVKLDVAKISGHGSVPVLSFKKILSNAIGNPWKLSCPTVNGGTANLDRLSSSSTYYINSGTNCYKYIPGSLLQQDETAVTSATDCSSSFGTGTIVSLGTLDTATSTSISKKWESGTFNADCATTDLLHRATVTGTVSTSATSVTATVTQPTGCDYAVVLSIPATELCKDATIAS